VNDNCNEINVFQIFLEVV